MRTLTIAIIGFALCASAALAGGITVGLMTGINPNVLHFNRTIAKHQIQMGEYAEADNLSNSGNTSIDKSSSSIIGIPLGLNVRYLEQFYIIRLGLLYHLSTGGKNAITTDKNSGSPRTLSQEYSMRAAEIPLTFAFNIRNDEYTRFYAGFGPSLHFGSAKIVSNNGTKNNDGFDTTPDTDIYNGWAIGAHIVVGGEVAIASALSLSMEVAFNYGNKAPVTDTSITESGKLDIQQGENKDAPEVLGIYNFQTDTKVARYDPEHPSGLDFNGIELLISVNFFLGSI